MRSITPPDSKMRERRCDETVGSLTPHNADAGAGVATLSTPHKLTRALGCPTVTSLSLFSSQEQNKRVVGEANYRPLGGPVDSRYESRARCDEIPEVHQGVRTEGPLPTWRGWRVSVGHLTICEKRVVNGTKASTTTQDRLEGFKTATDLCAVKCRDTVVQPMATQWSMSKVK